MFRLLGKLLTLFFAMICLLLIAAVFVIGLALLVRFKLLAAIAAVFLFIVWLAADKSGVEVTINKPEASGPMKGKYQYITPEGDVVYFDEDVKNKA